MRKQMNQMDVMKKDHYRSIIYLLDDFQMQHCKKPTRGLDGTIHVYNSLLGLKQIHFRFALMENPDIYKPTYNKLKRFFNNSEIFPLQPRLDDWYKENNIVKSIKSPQKLTNYLDKLIEIGIIEKHGKKPYTRYILSPNFYRDIYKGLINKYLDIWQSNVLMPEWNVYKYVLNNKDVFKPNLNEIIDILGSDKKNKSNNMVFEPKWIISGIPGNILFKLSEDEKSNLNKWLLDIDKNLWNIMKLKCQKMGLSKNKSNTKQKDVFNFNEQNSIGFYYTSSLSYIK